MVMQQQFTKHFTLTLNDGGLAIGIIDLFKGSNGDITQFLYDHQEENLRIVVHKKGESFSCQFARSEKG